MACWLHTLVLMALAYVVGATPFGYLIGKSRGIDVRRFGSGNIGATNVMRVLGKKIGITVFVLDALKGLLPVLAASAWTSRSPAFAGHATAAQLAEVLTGLATVLGHTATFWLGFKGGKGVATSAGVVLGMAPWALLAALVVWLVAMKIWRFVSLASILAGWALPVAVAVRGSWTGTLRAVTASGSTADALPRAVADSIPNAPLLALTFFLAVLVTWRHRSNLKRIAGGTEPRAGEARSNPT